MSLHATLTRPDNRNSTLLSDATDVYVSLAEFSDQDIAESLGGDTSPDTALAIELARQEAQMFQQFNDDLALALRLQEEPIDPPPRQAMNATGTTNIIRGPRGSQMAGVASYSPKNGATTWVGWLASWWQYSSNSKGQAHNTGVSASPTAAAETSRARERQLTGHDCVICGDAIRGSEVRTPCGHFYDKDCIVELFQAATRDESLYPPRCCRQKIPPASVEPLMTAGAIELFHEKGKEFGTLKRVYCCNPRCSRFLCAQLEAAPWFSTGFVKCTAAGCNTETCAVCKGRVDPNSTIRHYCRKDENNEAVLNLGRQSRWARCPGCESLIELNTGCFHMTCRCKTEFCYLCRATWKTCRCPQWDERRLLVAAEARVDAQLGLPPVRREIHPPRFVPPVRNDALERARLARAEVGVARRVDAIHAPAAHPPHRPAAAPLTNTGRSDVRNIQPPVAASTAQATSTPHRTWASLSSTSNRSNSTPGSSSSSDTIYRGAISPMDVNSWINNTRNSSSAKTSSQDRTNNQPWYRDSRAPLPVNTPSNANKGKQRERPDRARLVREAMEHLRVNHECVHANWKYRRGGGRCENCHHNLPLYLFRCKSCEILTCNRCRRNRL